MEESRADEPCMRRRRKVPLIKVSVTDEDKAKIVERAVQDGLSLSAFLLATSLNNPINRGLTSEVLRF